MGTQATRPRGRRAAAKKETDVLRELTTGLVAGAAGTVALNATTYADMALRGRPGSSTPKEVVERSAERLGIGLARAEESEEQRGNRASGLGALMGYVTGLGIGATYGLLRGRIADAPSTLSGVGVGLAAMAASNIPMTALGVTDPREWSRTSWLMDIVPHLAYGVVTVAVHDGFVGRRAR